jgi:tetratricopeptide (TPR) repeat protein
MQISLPFQIKGEVRDRLGLFFFFVLLAGAFSLATVAANAYHNERAGLAKRWFDRGQAALRANALEGAIQDYRNALAYDRDNPEYQLQLARALAKLGNATQNPREKQDRYNEASSYLLGLWERQPGRGTINLQLARLSAAQGDFPSAMRYYHNAVFGLWEEDPEEQRRQVRFELIRYLLDQNSRTQADAELISLADEAPDTAEAHVDIGNLFLRTEDYARALQQFQMALRLDRNADHAALGAGDAAFQLARYSLAERYLRREARAHPDDERPKRLLDVMEQMNQLNPYSYRLSSGERADRVLQAYQAANARLAACMGAKPNNVALQTLQQQSSDLKDTATRAKLRHGTANVDAVMNLVFSVERQTALLCGKPVGTDYALLLLGQEREAMEQ